MNQAERLFHIIAILKTKKMGTAEQLALELNVSVRTIYRDIKMLNASGVSIRGEAGVGYRLTDNLDYPSPHLTKTELKALAMGAQLLKKSVDQSSSDAAHRAVYKLQQQHLSQ